MNGPERSLVGYISKSRLIFYILTSSEIIEVGHSLRERFRVNVSNESICHAKGSFRVVGKVVVVGVQSVLGRVIAHR